MLRWAARLRRRVELAPGGPTGPTAYARARLGELHGAVNRARPVDARIAAEKARVRAGAEPRDDVIERGAR